MRKLAPAYSIITTDTNKKMSGLYDRAPLMLPMKNGPAGWIPGKHNTKALKDLLNPFPHNAASYYPASHK